ncbi:MAG: PhnD/SsuA/transferrin family substrate-binding protein [Deinococcota bacterium]|nr:PhnD/SsuA/transferrin family substrate-binding protein [Deinococcota bacterium]
MRYLCKTLLATIFAASAVASAQTGDAVRVGLEAVGTFSWVTYAMEHYGVDQELGLNLETTTYATKQAKELALRAGEADIVVDDFLGPVLWREQGIPAKAVYPYSLATGGVVVPAGSDIQSVEDLRDSTLAATNLRDKSLLILRTLGVSQYGFDPQLEGEVIAAAPPLMEELLARGEVDAAIPPWHFIARMVGSGDYREVIANTEMLEQLGMSSDLPILVVVARDDLDPEVLRRFLQGMEMTVERMQQDEEIWDLILAEELYSLPDPSLFPRVVERWEMGLPQVWDQEVIDGLARLVDEMVALAGAEVVGVERFDPDAYTTEFAPSSP